jgi:hypothetical protein
VTDYAGSHHAGSGAEKTDEPTGTEEAPKPEKAKEGEKAEAAAPDKIK